MADAPIRILLVGHCGPDAYALRSAIGGMVPGASVEFVRAFTKALRVNYSIVQSRAEIERSFGEVLALPTTFVVDRAGRIVSTHVGEIDPHRVEREVKALLGS